MRRPYSRLAAASALSVAIASLTIGPAFAGGNPNAPGQEKKADSTASQPAALSTQAPQVSGSGSSSNNTSSSNSSTSNTAGTTSGTNNTTAGTSSSGGVLGATTTLAKPKARGAHGGVLGTTAKIRGGRLP